LKERIRNLAADYKDAGRTDRALAVRHFPVP